MNGKRILATPSVLLLFLTGASAVALAQQPLVANEAIDWVAKSAKNPTLDERKGDLKFDDAAKKLVFESGKQSFDTSYDGVRRIVFDEATHLRPRRQMLKQIDEQMKRAHGDYWMYVEFAAPGGQLAKHMLQIPRESAMQVVDKAKQVFAGRVVVTDVHIGVRFDAKTLKEVASKHTFELAERKKHPLPDLKPDKAVIVVVHPIYVSGGGGLLLSKFVHHKPGEMNDYQVKIHANDRVVLVNRVGTYGFAYLDPGDYQIVAKGKLQQGSALQIAAEAGKAYYFLVDDFDDSPGFDVQLSQHSPELVMHKLGEAYFAEWAQKGK